MRARCLALAADLDRIERAEGGADFLKTSLQQQRIWDALAILIEDEPDRAQRLQLLLSDRTDTEA